ncbi:MAG: hypothetical protein AAGE01_12775 [Pseudomonadota bacterium]
MVIEVAETGPEGDRAKAVVGAPNDEQLTGSRAAELANRRNRDPVRVREEVGNLPQLSRFRANGDLARRTGRQVQLDENVVPGKECGSAFPIQRRESVGVGEGDERVRSEIDDDLA